MKKLMSLILVICVALSMSSCGEKKSYAFATENFGEDLYVIGMRKGEDALTQKINTTLEVLKSNGVAAEISEKWFGEDILIRSDYHPGPQATDDSWKYIEYKGTLVVGLDDTFAPMGFHDETGALVGFDIDLATALCKELGVEVKFQSIDWDAKEFELNNKNIDCIWNGMSSTPERQESMNLSAPYLNNVLVIMTMDDSDIKLKSDLAGKNIATQADSSGLKVIQDDKIYDSVKDTLTEYPTYDEALMDLENGRVDAVIIDQVLGMYKKSQKDNKSK